MDGNGETDDAEFSFQHRGDHPSGVEVPAGFPTVVGIVGIRNEVLDGAHELGYLVVEVLDDVVWGDVDRRSRSRVDQRSRSGGTSGLIGWKRWPRWSFGPVVVQLSGLRPERNYLEPSGWTWWTWPT